MSKIVAIALMESCCILVSTFEVYMFSLLLFDFIKTPYWTVEWRLQLYQEDGGSDFAFGLVKGKRFVLPDVVHRF